MIIVYIAGGLGDQMSRYALGRYLSKLNNIELLLDNSFYSSKDNYAESDTRSFGLNNFNITAALATKKQIDHLKTNRYSLRFGYRKSSHLSSGSLADLVNRSVTSDLYIDTRCGSYRDWSAVRAELLAEFALKQALPVPSKLQDYLKSGSIVGLHCRRGDKANNPAVNKIHGVCSVDYYQEALTLLETRLGDFKLLIFSDDPDWVKGNLSFKQDYQFANDYQLSDAQELTLLSQCQHQITANSAFSHWAAWLNTNPDKIIIAPRQLTVQASIESDELPATWLRL